MARVVCVHGVAQQQRGERSLLQHWGPAIADGIARAGGPIVPDSDVAMAFYGDLFRPAGQLLAIGDPLYRAADVQPGLEKDLLLAWWKEAAAVDPAVVGPETDTLVRTPAAVQAGLLALSRSRFFASVALRALVFDLKQVARYLLEPQVRLAARARVAALITAETRVVVAHSLGSVVAYETLCSLPGNPVRALITIGSPLGIPNLIFDRLDPQPRSGCGSWPGSENMVWTNIADASDVVALEKDLRLRFGNRVCNIIVHNGAHAHEVTAYLTDRWTGEAITRGLDER